MMVLNRREDGLLNVSEASDVSEYDRPSTRGDCLQGEHAQRPCPFVTCSHHLYLDVNRRNGSVRTTQPDREVWELEETCAVDIADRGGVILEEVGAIMNLTRERVRQIEEEAIDKLRRSPAAIAVLVFLDD